MGDWDDAVRVVLASGLETVQRHRVDERVAVVGRHDRHIRGPQLRGTWIEARMRDSSPRTQWSSVLRGNVPRWFCGSRFLEVGSSVLSLVEAT